MSKYKTIKVTEEQHQLLTIHKVQGKIKTLGEAVGDLLDSKSEDINSINRFIEFPPGYIQAGTLILSYFSTVLRKKYPGKSAYSILAFALLGVTSVFYFIYHWFLA